MCGASVTEEPPIEFIEDDRKWVPLCTQADEVSARLTITWLESNQIEARLGDWDGEVCIEVPEEDYRLAVGIYDPQASRIVPPMQETSSATGKHTQRVISAAMNEQRRERQEILRQQRGRRHLRWLIVGLLLGAATGLVYWYLNR